MRRLHFLVEGQTEETMVRDLLVPYFLEQTWNPTYSILTSKRLAGGSYKGGVAKWSRIVSELGQLLASGFDVVTTVIDYYGLPRDTPGIADRPHADAVARVEHVERGIAIAVADHRFVPHLALHETEAWVLASGAQLAEQLGDPLLGKRCRQAIEAAGGAELVNDGEMTAPSKRLLAWRPSYRKTIDGPAAVIELGLDGLRNQCPHMDTWLRTIERWQ